MGIRKQEFYLLGCERCKEVYDYMETEGSVVRFNSKEELIEAVTEKDNGWRKINGRWYCPKCVGELFDYNEESGVYTPKAGVDLGVRRGDKLCIAGYREIEGDFIPIEVICDDILLAPMKKMLEEVRAFKTESECKDRCDRLTREVRNIAWKEEKVQ